MNQLLRQPVLLIEYNNPNGFRYVLVSSSPSQIVASGIGKLELVMPVATACSIGQVFTVTNTSTDVIAVHEQTGIGASKHTNSIPPGATCTCILATHTPKPEETFWYYDMESSDKEAMQHARQSIEAYGFDTSKMNGFQLIDLLLELAFVKPVQGQG